MQNQSTSSSTQISDWNQRSDAMQQEIEKSKPFNDKRKARKTNKILKSLSWCTNQPVESALVMYYKNESGSGSDRYFDGFDGNICYRPLTAEELSSPYCPFPLPSKEYILIQVDAASHPKTDNSLPSSRIVKNGAPLKDVLEHIYNMTMSEGDFAITNHFDFEGLASISHPYKNIVLVETGS